MIYDTTHTNIEAKEVFEDLLGKPYSFLKALKLGGVGSKRMMIEKVSPKFSSMMNNVSDINYGNIELREKGILVHINKGLKNYSWAIPFYQLHIYNTQTFSIHAQGNFVQFKKNNLLKENKSFLDKLVDLKIENRKLYELY
ncbi:hypothetical protein [Polaribacter gangjinensis]|uniref:Uncharacterized protein n=1 Tax=Polaribacter gangjinensis TaxID=574710 RepID=A0A2S7WB97_9FLAO|nr:hypothetical protein [Polaribacter gangjinensis]PQJ74883.1 hypothetical protein BTO13_06315 [Polaribacter gangjinensis]